MANKSITIISLNYYPEDTAIGLYSTQMAQFLVAKGWEVKVITGFPYYPQWKIRDDYENKETFFSENVNGVEILRFKQFVPIEPSFSKRMLQVMDFTIGTLFNINRVKKSDVVLSIIPFTSSAWLGKRLARKCNAKHWIHIQDFEFDAAIESGLISNKGIGGVLSNGLMKLEKGILDSADLVSTISNGMLRKLSGKSKSETFFFPNWVDGKVINPEIAALHPHLNSEKFTILYSGNIGAKQDWQLFMDVVDRMQDMKKVEFVIVGAGAMQRILEMKTEKYENVRMFPPVPISELNDLLCSADIHVLFQKTQVVDTVMPSKILGMMCSQRPSIVSGNIESEVASVFEASNGGKYITSQNADEVVSQMIALMNDQVIRKEMGNAARKFVLYAYSESEVLDSFNIRLKKIISIE